MKWIKASETKLIYGKVYIAKWKTKFVNNGVFSGDYFFFDAAPYYKSINKKDFDKLFVLTEPDVDSVEQQEQFWEAVSKIIFRHYGAYNYPSQAFKQLAAQYIITKK